MRITSGKARGISLKSPKGDATRPATDAARQAVFSSIADFVSGARVVDFFAGTGSYGLEALSRGAKSAVFVESGRNALDCLKANLAAVEKSMGRLDARIVSKDAFSYVSNESEELPDIIFADPPYDFFYKNPEGVFGLLKKNSSQETLVVLEAPADFEYGGEDFEILKRLGKKGKGKPSQLILRLKDSAL